MALHLIDVIVAVTILLSLLASSTVRVPSPMEYCDVPDNYNVMVKEVDVKPYYVKDGSPVSFNITATAEGTITGGKIVFRDTSYGAPRGSVTIELCSGTSCPIDAGNDFVISYTKDAHKRAPYYEPHEIKMEIFDESSHQLTCIRFGYAIVDFGSESGVASV